MTKHLLIRYSRWRKRMCYEENIHKDRISLSESQNEFKKRTLKFYILRLWLYSFCVSIDVSVVSRNKTHELTLVEVQV